MATNNTRLIPTAIWQDQIERPEEVDEAIARIDDVMKILRRKRTNLRSLRRICVQVYGEPTIEVEYEDSGEPTMFDHKPGGDDDDSRAGEDGACDADGAAAILPEPIAGDIAGVEAAGVGTRSRRRRDPRPEATPPE